MSSFIIEHCLPTENLPYAFAYHQMITDSEGKPVDFTFLDVNRAFETMTGLSREQIVGNKVTEVLPGIEESTFDWIGVYGKVALTGESIHFKQYSEPLARWYEIMAYSDKPGFFAVLFFDITEYKKAEEQLTKSEERYRALFNQSMEGIYLHDLQGRILDVNDMACAQSGYTREQWRSLTVFDGLSSKSKINLPKDIFTRSWEQWEPGERHMLEAEHQRKDGTVYPVEISTGVIRHGDENVVLAIVKDITDRKKHETELKYISFHDQLTELYNRHFLEEEMKRLDTVRQLPISIIMADLNGLKLINDTYGHEKGDHFLISAALILRNVCRDEDIIARWGGDEFVILLPQTTLGEAQLIGKRILSNCQKITVEQIPVSIALAAASKTVETQSLADILREAEDSMYKQKLTESRSTKSTVLQALLKALAEKSFETETHTRRMQKIARRIGEKVGLPDSELSRLNLLITLHDIGKINITEEILTKDCSLSTDEWEAIKKHPEVGYRIARATEEFSHVADEILAHHERFDGTGYPQSKGGEIIPLLARIAAIADAYEVMSFGRPYKKAMSKQEIMTEFKRCAGTQFDPNLVEIVLPIIGEEHYLNG